MSPESTPPLPGVVFESHSPGLARLAPSEPLPAALTRNVCCSSSGGHRYMRADSKRATRWGWPLVALLSVAAGVLSTGY
jgi:hypothetical protein